MVIRKIRSLILICARRLMCTCRILIARIGNDEVIIPWSTHIGARAKIRVTDGGRLRIGSRVSIGEQCIIVVGGGVVEIGESGFIGHGCTLVAHQSIVIGDRVLIAEYVTIRDQDHRTDRTSTISDSGFDTSPIVLGNDVWLGAKATIARGVTIGSHAVIGAHAFVNRDVPANGVAVGIPARVIRYRKRSPDG